jgi:hypothetical protein
VSGDDTPRTTVVIPVWGRYVNSRFAAVLESVTSQTQGGAVLIVDNASEDPPGPVGGARVIRSYRRVTLGAARDLGLAQVQTPNVVFWDADDLMPPGTLAFMQTQMQADPNLVAFAMALTEDPSGVRHRWPRRWIARLIRFPRALALINSVWSVYPANGAVIMRTAVVRACGAHSDTPTGDERSLGASLLFRGRVGWSERPGCIYLRHPGSNSDARANIRTKLTNAAQVRARLRADPAVPDSVRRSLPLIAVAQWCAVAAHLVVAAARRLTAAKR